MAVLADGAPPREVLRNVCSRVADLIASIDDMDRPVPGHGWTVGQVAAHMILATRGNAASMAGDVDQLLQFVPDTDGYADRMAGMNKNAIAAEPVRDATSASLALREAVSAFLNQAEQQSADDTVPTPWYAPGASLSVDVDTRWLVGHLLNHALDIASGLGREWPLAKDEVLVAIPSIHALMPRTVDAMAARHVKATFCVRVRGGDTVGIRIRDGAVDLASWGTWDVRPDCTISAEPIAYFLVAYGRVSQWPLIARGRLLSYGRKPWLAFRFRGLFVNP